MTVKVVDASAVAALLFGEPDGPAVAVRLRHVRLVAPSLLSFELANVCLEKMRRHAEQRQALLDAFAMLQGMEINEIEVDHRHVLKLAEQDSLTAYDASYLWLALRLGAELITLDRRLAAASAKR